LPFLQSVSTIGFSERGRMRAKRQQRLPQYVQIYRRGEYEYY
jgi:hypothetical protein